FATVLNASDGWRARDFDHLIRGAHPDCRLQRLQDAPHAAWSSLAAMRRVPATYSNVAAYVEWEERVDADLALLLKAVEEISGVDEVSVGERRSLALAIVNASGELSETRRIKLARSLRPGKLTTSLITPESGGF